MLILLLLVALTLVFGLAVIALIDVRTIGNSWKQAFWLAPIKALYRLDNSDLADANKARGPVIYALSEQSLMDPAIFLASLPDDTLHVLDPAELDLPYQGRIMFEDMRGNNQTIISNAADIKSEYHQRMLRQIEDIQKLCARWGWTYVLHRTDMTYTFTAMNIWLKGAQ